jgi:hypothetical protein
MVRDAAADRHGRFRRADIETAVKLESITIDDFTGKSCRDAQGKFTLAGCGRPHDGD